MKSCYSVLQEHPAAADRESERRGGRDPRARVRRADRDAEAGPPHRILPGTLYVTSLL